MPPNPPGCGCGFTILEPVLDFETSSWAPLTPACEWGDLGEGFLNKPVSLSPGGLISNNECVVFLLHGRASSLTTSAKGQSRQGLLSPLLPQAAPGASGKDFLARSPLLLLRYLQGVPLGQGGNLGSGPSQSTSWSLELLSW